MTGGGIRPTRRQLMMITQNIQTPTQEVISQSRKTMRTNKILLQPNEQATNALRRIESSTANLTENRCIIRQNQTATRFVKYLEKMRTRQAYFETVHIGLNINYDKMSQELRVMFITLRSYFLPSKPYAYFFYFLQLWIQTYQTLRFYSFFLLLYITIGTKAVSYTHLDVYKRQMSP